MIHPPGDGQNRETETAVYFYTSRFDVLDNFFACTVHIWGRRFFTSEQAYLWRKYSDSHPDIAEEIFNAENPYAVKKISDAHKDKVPATWQDEKVAVMREILSAKMEQHETVRERLLETGNREIIENSPTDSFWGIGPDGSGENMLGKLWMKLRDELKSTTKDQRQTTKDHQ